MTKFYSIRGQRTLLNKKNYQITLLAIISIFILLILYIHNSYIIELTENSNHLKNNTSIGYQITPSNTLESSITRAGTSIINYQYFNNNTEYLIITPQAFIDVLIPLKEWKHQKGVFTNIVPIDGVNGINSTFPGQDLPEKIHWFLREYYKHALNLKWLLLVGDSEIIPPRLLRVNVTDNKENVEIVNFCYSDYYYSALETDWDNNSNSLYGEPGEEDWTPELFVGRLPVNTIDETEIAINKILVYEKNPPLGDWYTRSIQCGALMDRPNVIDDLNTIADEGYNDYKDNAYKVIKKIWEILPENMENITFLDYAQIPGGNYSKTKDTLNESNVLSAFNLGASTVNFVSKGDDNGVRHYNGNGLGWIEFSSEYFFNYKTAKNSKNGLKLPFLYTSSCTSVNFTNTDDTNLEQLIISPSGGSIGVIGATTETFRLEFLINNSSYGNWWLDFEFWQRFYNGTGRYRPGEILYKLKEDYYKHVNDLNNPYPTGVYKSLYRTNFFSYNLLGDPEIPIYTDIPKKLKVEYDKIYSPIHKNNVLKIRVLDDQTLKPISDADVCLIGNNYYQTVSTGIDGVAEFNIKAQDDSRFNITVTAHNYNYFFDVFSIKAKEDILIKNNKINFNKNPITPGATVNISFEVQNNGSSLIPDLEINCYYDQINNDNIINSSIHIKDLASGETKQVLLNWQAVTGEHEIFIVLDPKNEIFEFDKENNIASAILKENKPPTFFNLPYISIKEDIAAEDVLDLRSYVWDDDSEDLEFSITNKSNLNFDISINGTMISIYPYNDYHGSSSATISVFDGTSVDSNILNIEIISVNDPPILNDTIDWYIFSQNTTVTPGKISVYEDQIVDFLITANDIDDNSSKLRFFSNSNLFYINTTSGRVTFIPKNNAVGLHLINFSVTDNNKENNVSWRKIFFEVVNVNDPPELILSKTYFQLDVGEELNFIVIGYDIDTGDNIRFTEDTRLFDIDPITGNISFVPKYNQIGHHTIAITVSDGKINVTKILTIEINSPPEKPLEPDYVLICPVILVIIVLLLVFQEFRKNKQLKSELESKTNGSVKPNTHNETAPKKRRKRGKNRKHR